MGDLSESPEKKSKKSDDIILQEKYQKEISRGNRPNRKTNLKDKDKKLSGVTRVRNKKTETSEDESASEETPVLRRTRRIPKDFPLLKEIEGVGCDLGTSLEKKNNENTPASRNVDRVITNENTPKDSPLFTRLRNRRIIESSDEESGGSGIEQTPDTRRKEKRILHL